MAESFLPPPRCSSWLPHPSSSSALLFARDGAQRLPLARRALNQGRCSCQCQAEVSAFCTFCRACVRTRDDLYIVSRHSYLLPERCVRHRQQARREPSWQLAWHALGAPAHSLFVEMSSSSARDERPTRSMLTCRCGSR